jgi:hypothetical protein
MQAGITASQYQLSENGGSEVPREIDLPAESVVGISSAA